MPLGFSFHVIIGVKGAGQGWEDAFLKIQALAGVEVGGLTDVLRVLSIGKCKELDKSMIKTEGRV